MHKLIVIALVLVSIAGHRGHGGRRHRGREDVDHPHKGPRGRPAHHPRFHFPADANLQSPEEPHDPIRTDSGVDEEPQPGDRSRGRRPPRPDRPPHKRHRRQRRGRRGARGGKKCKFGLWSRVKGWFGFAKDHHHERSRGRPGRCRPHHWKKDWGRGSSKRWRHHKRGWFRGHIHRIWKKVSSFYRGRPRHRRPHNASDHQHGPGHHGHAHPRSFGRFRGGHGRCRHGRGGFEGFASRFRPRMGTCGRHNRFGFRPRFGRDRPPHAFFKWAYAEWNEKHRHSQNWTASPSSSSNDESRSSTQDPAPGQETHPKSSPSNSVREHVRSQLNQEGDFVNHKISKTQSLVSLYRQIVFGYHIDSLREEDPSRVKEECFSRFMAFVTQWTRAIKDIGTSGVETLRVDILEGLIHAFSADQCMRDLYHLSLKKGTSGPPMGFTEWEEWSTRLSRDAQPVFKHLAKFRPKKLRVAALRILQDVTQDSGSGPV